MKRRMKSPAPVILVTLLCLFAVAPLSAKTLKFRDRDPKRYELSARASEIDPRAKSHPGIDFTFETKEGKPPTCRRPRSTPLSPREASS